MIFDFLLKQFLPLSLNLRTTFVPIPYLKIWEDTWIFQSITFIKIISITNNLIKCDNLFLFILAFRILLMRMSKFLFIVQHCYIYFSIGSLLNSRDYFLKLIFKSLDFISLFKETIEEICSWIGNLIQIIYTFFLISRLFYGLVKLAFKIAKRIGFLCYLSCLQQLYDTNFSQFFIKVLFHHCVHAIIK